MRIAGISIWLFAAACSTEEGVRCNPERYSDECNGAEGLICLIPAGCIPVSYCCPTNRTSTNPNCQACPALDGGID